MAYGTDTQDTKEEAGISEPAVEGLSEDRDCMVDSVQPHDTESISVHHEFSVTSPGVHGTKSLSIYDAGSTNDREIMSLADLAERRSPQEAEESRHTNQAHEQEQSSITQDHHNSHDILLKGVTPYGAIGVGHTEDSCTEIEDEDVINLDDSHSNFGVNVSDPAAISRFLGMLQKKGILEKHGYKKEPASPPSDDEGHTEILATNSPGSKGSWGCPVCPKTFGRRCELR